MCGGPCPDLEILRAACPSGHQKGKWLLGAHSSNPPPLVYKWFFSVYKPLSINSFLFTVALSGWSIPVQTVEAMIVTDAISWVF